MWVIQVFIFIAVVLLVLCDAQIFSLQFSVAPVVLDVSAQTSVAILKGKSGGYSGICYMYFYILLQSDLVHYCRNTVNDFVDGTLVFMFA